MNKEDVVTLENNKDYVILDIVEFNGDKYLYVVGIDENEAPTDDYRYLRAVMEDNELYTEEVTDPNLLELIISLFTTNYLNESVNEEQAA